MATPIKPDNKLEVSYTPETMSSKSTSSSPECSVSGEFLEFEGTTTFAAPPSPTYRYSMSLKSGKLRIWLEDCESKKQWCTTKLSLEDYVDATNAIPNATPTDYVEYFHELLDDVRDDAAHIPITFQRHKGKVFRLEVTVKIQVLRQSRLATYIIDMEPISLERIDVLESKMRDLQEEVEHLREEGDEVIVNQSRGLHDLKVEVKLQQEDLDKREGEIVELQKELEELRVAHDSSTTVQMLATTRQGEWILWGNASSVRMLIPGTYEVTVIVNYQTNSANATIQLVKGNKVIQSVYCGVDQGYCNSTSLVCITAVEKNDQFLVKCPVGLTGTSYLTLIRIGK
ncbi:hypothetical protein PHYPSEUDO_010960 [Phytophthora pseudosyringae]|uniref:Uncharacterized protein n=1 Tax=Phytophthora pseudosyringae TaxID=221518 RepID=A0A8T1W8V8_9STRA|nr:hypothetical protein PHYPSEUDO_010960 [Phytophthora pseudosyringae]